MFRLVISIIFILFVSFPASAEYSGPKASIRASAYGEAKLYVNNKKVTDVKDGKIKEKDVHIFTGDVIGFEFKGLDTKKTCAWAALEVYMPDGTIITTGTPGWRSVAKQEPIKELWNLPAFEPACEWEGARNMDDCGSVDDVISAQKIWANGVSIHEDIYLRHRVGGEVCSTWSGSCKADVTFQSDALLSVFLRSNKIISDNHWALLASSDQAVVSSGHVLAIHVQGSDSPGFFKGIVKSENGRYTYTADHMKCLSVESGETEPLSISSGNWSATSFDDSDWDYYPSELSEVFTDRQRFTPGKLLSVDEYENVYCRLEIPTGFCTPVLLADTETKMCNEADGIVCWDGTYCDTEGGSYSDYGFCKEEKGEVSKGEVCADPKSQCKDSICTTEELTTDPLVSIPTCKKYKDQGFAFGPPTNDPTDIENQPHVKYTCKPGLLQVGPNRVCTSACELSMKLFGGDRISASITHVDQSPFTHELVANRWSVLKASEVIVRPGDKIQVQVTQAGRYIPFSGILSFSSGRVHATSSIDWTTSQGDSVVVFSVRPQEHPFPGRTAFPLARSGDTLENYYAVTNYEFTFPSDVCDDADIGILGSSCGQLPCGTGLVCGKDNLCVSAENLLRENENCADTDRSCASWLWCRKTPGLQPMCTPRLKFGDRCVAVEGGCADGFYCEPESGTCAMTYQARDQMIKCIYRETPALKELLAVTRGIDIDSGDETSVECMPLTEFLEVAYDRAFMLYRRQVSVEHALHLFHYARGVVRNLRICAPGVNTDKTVCIPKATLYVIGMAAAKLNAQVSDVPLDNLSNEEKQAYINLRFAAVSIDVNEILPKDVTDWGYFEGGATSRMAMRDPRPINNSTTNRSSKNSSSKNSSSMNSSSMNSSSTNMTSISERQMDMTVTERNGRGCYSGYRWYETAVMMNSDEGCCSDQCFTYRDQLNVVWDDWIVAGCCETCNQAGCWAIDEQIMSLSEVWVPSFIEEQYSALPVIL